METNVKKNKTQHNSNNKKDKGTNVFDCDKIFE